MKFRLTTSHSYWWPVTVRVPAPEAERAGQYDERGLKVLFAPQSRDQAVAAQEVYSKLQTTEEMVEHEVKTLLETVRDWADVLDEDGQPLPFSGTALRQALQTSWFRAAIHQAYGQSLHGEAARLGN